MKKITALLLTVVFMCLPLFSCTGSGGLDGLTNETTGGNTPVVPDIDGSQIAFTTDNFSVDLATVSFFFNGIYSTDKAQYGSYMTMMGLDTTKPLKDQKYGDGTWFDFYLDSALDQLENTLLLCEYAHSCGIELSDADKKQLDDSMKAVETQAKTKNVSVAQLIADYYGPLVTEEKLRSCLELELLSEKGYEHYIGTLSYSEERYEEYYAENKELFDYVDIYKYTVYSNIPEDATQEEADAMMADAKAKAEYICSAETLEEFKVRLGEYIKSFYTGENELSENAVASRIESALTAGVTVNQLIEAGFEKDCDFAPGSYAVVENGENYIFIYTVTEPVRSSNLVADMRYILLTPENYETEELAREKAKEIHDEYLAGDKTVESFSALVNEYSDEEYNKSVGGLVEDIIEGALKEEIEINKWLFDRNRVKGDTAIVNTTAGIMVVYFEAFTGEKWQTEVRQYLQNDDYLAKLEDLRGSVKCTKIDEVISQFEA